mmetsp:Transcript_84163/g.158428  ORF Transcript_84163/g.158428 Transcript_84163/m.158428 type:complete len:150 (+) Transcript_84163:328-777(+)
MPTNRLSAFRHRRRRHHPPRHRRQRQRQRRHQPPRHRRQTATSKRDSTFSCAPRTYAPNAHKLSAQSHANRSRKAFQTAGVQTGRHPVPVTAMEISRGRANTETSVTTAKMHRKLRHHLLSRSFYTDVHKSSDCPKEADILPNRGGKKK